MNQMMKEYANMSNNDNNNDNKNKANDDILVIEPSFAHPNPLPGSVQLTHIKTKYVIAFFTSQEIAEKQKAIILENFPDIAHWDLRQARKFGIYYRGILATSPNMKEF